jgi:hypothetical protein
MPIIPRNLIRIFLRGWYNDIGMMIAIGDYEQKALTDAAHLLRLAKSRGYEIDDDVLQRWYYYYAADPEIHSLVHAYRTC